MAENNNSNPIVTVAGLMSSLEEEVKEIRAGKMPIEMARVVSKVRDNQIKLAQLELQWQRLQRNHMRVKAKDRNLITGDQIIPAEPEKAEERKE